MSPNAGPPAPGLSFSEIFEQEAPWPGGREFLLSRLETMKGVGLTAAMTSTGYVWLGTPPELFGGGPERPDGTTARLNAALASALEQYSSNGVLERLKGFIGKPDTHANLWEIQQNITAYDRELAAANGAELWRVVGAWLGLLPPPGDMLRYGDPRLAAIALAQAKEMAAFDVGPMRPEDFQRIMNLTKALPVPEELAMMQAREWACDESPAAVRIVADLAAIEKIHGVMILFAVESGSRAWGFPSADSDYDVRFVYVHPPEWYLGIREGRDVIERPIRGDLDVNGWELRKALRLLRKSNPSLLEWFTSPTRYVWTSAANDLGAIAGSIVQPERLRRHYASLCKISWRDHCEGRRKVSIKKYFYVIRPALALRWIRLRGTIPPMNMPMMLPDLELPPLVIEAISELIRQKEDAGETGVTPPHEGINRIIWEEMRGAEAIVADAAEPSSAADPLEDFMLRQAAAAGVYVGNLSS